MYIGGGRGGVEWGWVCVCGLGGDRVWGWSCEGEWN